MRDLLPDDRDNRRGLDFDARHDFDADVASAEAEANAAQLDSALAQIIGGNHQVLVGFRRLEAQLAERSREDTRHVAALSKIIITPDAVTNAAFSGAVAGVRQQHGEEIQQVTKTVRQVEIVAKRLVENAEAERTERRIWVDATMYAASAAAVVILIAGTLGYILGSDSGARKGYAIARDEKAAASWALTPSGRFALELDQGGVLDRMRTCDHADYTRKKYRGRAVCYTTNGWYLP
jgi:hypothetical protein